ncbi:hypothetical protein BY458DRAFT_504608 [Sporodiniella umbellata]|nr:hypothetical protein BY458DRAFT_504608 [Sporodiniella umbellata]
MVKSQQWKSRLKSYEKSSGCQGSSWKATSTVETVNDKIQRLRIEQNRAETNRLRRHQPTLPQPNQVRYETNDIQQSAPLHVTAGPPPPPSWRSSIRERQVQIQRLQEKRRVLVTANDSLYSQCAHQAAKEILCGSKRKEWNNAIEVLSIPVKQTLMQYISLINGLDDTLFDPFVSLDYHDLCLEGSTVTFTKFFKAYWQLKEQQLEEEVENWWDHDVDSEEGYIHLPFNLRAAEKVDLKEEREIQIEPILSAFLKDQYPSCSSEALLDRQGFFLFSPLASNLTSLNISFSVQWPNLSLAYLIVTTLPAIQYLRTAGCFDSIDGPRAISIISQELRFLVLWDIGFHPWLTFDRICGVTGQIDWQRDLKELRTLYIQNLQEGVAAQIKGWIIENGFIHICVLD